jgi:hypothetical protein
VSTIYDETSEAYHDNAADGSGNIRDFIRSAALYHDRKNGIKLEETDALLFGHKSHMALLEPKRFAHEIAIKPEGMKFSNKDGIAWRDANEGKLIVSAKDAASLTRMHQRMPVEVRTLFDMCATEVTVRTVIDGLPVQCRPDLLHAASRSFYDLKTIGAIEDVEGSIWKRGYHIQLEWYERVLQAETGHRFASRLIFVESAPPHRWKICDLDPDHRAIARAAVDDALHGIKARMKSGCWDDKEDIHEIVCPPRWAEGMIPELVDSEEE